jgi:YD repeat-containing protein
VVNQKYVNGSSVNSDNFLYGYDRDGNRLYSDNEQDTTAGADAYDELFHANGANGYDGLGRLTDWRRGAISGGDTRYSSASRYQGWTFRLRQQPDGDQHERLDRPLSSSTRRTATRDCCTTATATTSAQTRSWRTTSWVYDAWDRLVLVTPASRARSTARAR